MNSASAKHFIQSFKNHQLSRYILVGCMNTLFGYSIFALLIAVGLHYVYATFLTTCAGVLFNFKSFGILVFKNKNNKLFLKFITVYLLIYFFNILIIKLTGYFLANVYACGAIAALLTAAITYFLNKHAVFKHYR